MQQIKSFWDGLDTRRRLIAALATVAIVAGIVGIARVAAEPDMALLDITMPGMTGLELAKHLKTHTTVPFMFLSAIGDSESSKEAAAYGAVGYLVKPVDAERLMPAFEAGLARADDIRQLRRTRDLVHKSVTQNRPDQSWPSIVAFSSIWEANKA